jgi:hypothetical protein
MQPTLKDRLSRKLEGLEVGGASVKTAQYDASMRAAAADDLKLLGNVDMRRRALEDPRPDVPEPTTGRWLAERLFEDDRGERPAGVEVRG